MFCRSGVISRRSIISLSRVDYFECLFWLEGCVHLCTFAGGKISCDKMVGLGMFSKAILFYVKEGTIKFIGLTKEKMNFHLD